MVGELASRPEEVHMAGSYAGSSPAHAPRVLSPWVLGGSPKKREPPLDGSEPFPRGVPGSHRTPPLTLIRRQT